MTDRVEAIELCLDGYTDLPRGKIANVVTYFEMTARPASGPKPLRSGLLVRTVLNPGIDWYRDLYRRIGEDWLWFSRAVMTDPQLAALLVDPATEVLALERADGIAVGLAELHRMKDEVEIAMFGVVPELTGTGVAGLLLKKALDHAWASRASRIWLHTCSFDHPAAVRFYTHAGFTPYKFAI
jgi:GNAT superfamily N-acetyltransferase